MNEITKMLLTLAVGISGGLLLYKLKFPSGGLVGGIVAVGILNIATGMAYVPGGMRVITYTLAGLYIGLSVDMDTVRNLKKVIKPAALLLILIQLLCISVGVVLYYVTDLDVVTALFCTAPGGITDMTLMTLDMGGDAPVVAVIQTLRLLSVFVVSMPLTRVISKKIHAGEEIAAGEMVAKRTFTPEEKKQGIKMSLVVALVAGAVGYVLATALDFKVIMLLTGMAFAAGVNIRTGKLYMPKMVRTIVQATSGSLIGLSVTYESLISLRAALGPALVACVCFVSVNIILALILNKTCKMDIVTAMLSSSAGGASEAALVASEFGGDACTVSVLQVSRLVATTTFYPLLVKALYTLL